MQRPLGELHGDILNDVNQNASNRVEMNSMRAALPLLVLLAALAGCTTYTSPRDELDSAAVVPSRYEPAAQLTDTGGGINDGAVVGAAGGAAIGAASAQASAGLLCTIGGPVCWVVMIPAAIVGGLVGGVTGGVVDAVTADPGGRIAKARSAIEQTIADMRFTEALAAKTSERARLPLSRGAESDKFTLEVEATGLEYLAREKDMALVVRGRSRLYRSADGELLEERVAEAQTKYRSYVDWAADDAKALRGAVDSALAEVSRAIVSERPGSRPRAGSAARPGG
jgi:hypothetical protein